MAKGQIRAPKEKRKPKADKTRPKHLSAYKQAQLGGASHVLVSASPKKT